MTNKELSDKLIEVKQTVTKLGHEYLNGRLPIELGNFGKEMMPIIRIEKAIKISIKQLNKK